VKTPDQAIAEAMTRLASSQLFHDERAAQLWVSNTALGLLRHKASEMGLTKEERDELNPIVAGLIHAKDLGTRQRRQRIGWMDALMDRVAASTFCETMPLSGTLSTWLIGRESDRQVALYLLSGLVPTAEKLSQDAYLKEYHTRRKAGKVAEARGSKDVWLSEWVENIDSVFKMQREQATKEFGNGLQDTLQQARGEVVEYMNDNFLPTKGNRTLRK
jgi:hypothetical protein